MLVSRGQTLNWSLAPRDYQNAFPLKAQYASLAGPDSQRESGPARLSECILYMAFCNAMTCVYYTHDGYHSNNCRRGMYFTGPVTADLQTLRLCVEYQFPTFISRNTLASNPGLPHTGKNKYHSMLFN